MHITPEEALETLDSIRHITVKAHGTFNFWAYYLLLWGTVWTLGFLTTQFFLQWTAWIWIVMVVIGMGGSAILGVTQAGRVRLAPESHAAFITSRFGLFNGVLYGFALLWLIIFTLTPLQIGMLWISVTMLSSIIAGVWFQEPLSIGLGVGIMFMSILGYYLLPHFFWLWAATFAGLPLVGISIFILRRR